MDKQTVGRSLGMRGWQLVRLFQRLDNYLTSIKQTTTKKVEERERALPCRESTRPGKVEIQKKRKLTKKSKGRERTLGLRLTPQKKFTSSRIRGYSLHFRHKISSLAKALKLISRKALKNIAKKGKDIYLVSEWIARKEVTHLEGSERETLWKDQGTQFEINRREGKELGNMSIGEWKLARGS